MSEDNKISQELLERQSKDYINLSQSCQLIYGKKFVDSLPFKPSDNVLDIGCGTGGLTEYTAKNKVPEGKVTAVDPDKERVKTAKEIFGAIQNISFHEGTALELLKDKKNLYDVIYSNVVIHWIPVEERRSTFKAIYAAAKPGGIIAHQYCEFLPDFLKGMMPILTENDRRIFDSMLHIIPTEDMNKLVSDCGFEVVSREVIVHDTKFKGLEDYFRFTQAVFHGQIPFYKRFCETKENIENGIQFLEDGSILKRTDLIRIVLRKPIN